MPDHNNENIIDAEEVSAPENMEARRAEAINKIQQMEQALAVAKQRMGIGGPGIGIRPEGVLGFLERLGIPYAMNKHVPLQPEHDTVTILVKDIEEADQRIAAEFRPQPMGNPMEPNENDTPEMAAKKQRVAEALANLRAVVESESQEGS